MTRKPITRLRDLVHDLDQVVKRLDRTEAGVELAALSLLAARFSLRAAIATLCGPEPVDKETP